MQRIGLLMVMGTAWLAASGAQAQVREGDVRLYLDAALVSWAKEVTETDGAGPLDGESESTTLSTGLLGAGGAGVGYAISPYLVPELYVSLQNVKADFGDGDGELTVRQWELRPCLEVPLLPDARFVPYLMGGLTLGRTVTKGDGDPDLTRFGVGPALGVGAHGFLTQHASLDLGLTFRGTFFVKNELEDQLGVEFNVKQYALLFTVGASFWL